MRELYIRLAEKSFGTTAFTVREHSFDLADEWKEYDFSRIIGDTYGFDPRDVDEATALAALEKSGIVYKKEGPMNRERAVDILWKKCRATCRVPASS